ncbi:NAD(P)-binding domain-containing protein [Arthrobacter sp. I2-34]|uniref:NAD(P)-binding domain-containing protein n=1 Tax=Arthrobacter hankyongi TaxID=2904801 RepID=A0ABS9L9C9_9MICC|nr:NAD(P)-binding domain-containing protein [Arthrobacter hankyongi]MCG2623240.1 NAD(P)-binding domain-containing protein [Arthrobacter hankyongi]
MTDITIIGNGNMARGIGTRAVAAGKSLQILGRDAEGAEALAQELGGDTLSGTTAEPPAGDIVVLALWFDAAKEVVSAYNDALAGKIIVDICNPVDTQTFDSLVVPADTSAAQEIAKLTGGDVVKAFNTTFAGTLMAGAVAGQPLDVFIAGDSADAKAKVAEFATAAGLRPLDVGGLRHARELEGIQLLAMGLSANPDNEFNWDTALKLIR